MFTNTVAIELQNRNIKNIIILDHSKYSLTCSINNKCDYQLDIMKNSFVYKNNKIEIKLKYYIYLVLTLKYTLKFCSFQPLYIFQDVLNISLLKKLYKQLFELVYKTNGVVDVIHCVFNLFQIKTYLLVMSDL